MRHAGRREGRSRRHRLPADFRGRRRGGATSAAASAPPPPAPLTTIEPVGARAYHDATKHSWQSVREGGHFLDWPIKPFLFKVYPDAPLIRLPREIATPAAPALEALAADPGPAPLDLATLAQLLFFAAGLTKRKAYPGGEAIHFRAAASTGALYEVEVYVVAGAVAGLEPGVYHFAPGEFALRRLRPGDYRAPLSDAASQPTRVGEAPACLVLSAIFWRNTWKYQARAYRHFFWDAGTLLANLLAVASAAAVPARVLLGFADSEVNRLLGLDPQREASLALVPVGSGAPSPPPVTVEPLDLATVPLSDREVDYPLIGQAYAASSLATGADTRSWATPPPAPAPRGSAAAVSHPLASERGGESPPLGEVILRRGSTRQFDREPISFAALSTILDVAVRELPLDVGVDGQRLVRCYLLVHAVDGLPPGAYVYDPEARGLRQLRVGEFREEGGYLCLEQTLGADASAVVFFLADVDSALARYGDRGYRLVNLVAGLYGGRMYLAAYALGLGASGLTFYDDDVVRFFSPDAAGLDAIFVTALGRARRAARGGLGQLAGAVEAVRPGET